AAKGSAGDALNAVEELENGGDAKEIGADFDDVRFRREETDELPRNEREQNDAARHHDGAEADAEHTARARGHAFADRATDAHRGCAAHAERAHEREARETERDLMRAGHGRSEASGEH